MFYNILLICIKLNLHIRRVIAHSRCGFGVSNCSASNYVKQLPAG